MLFVNWTFNANWILQIMRRWIIFLRFWNIRPEVCKILILNSCWIEPPTKRKKKSGKGYCSSKSRFWVGVKHWCVGMSMCQNLDVFSHTQAQEKWKSLDYQIVSNTKDINTKISAIHHSCRPVSVATVIYSRAKIHLDFLSLSLSIPHLLLTLKTTYKPKYHAQQLSRC